MASGSVGPDWEHTDSEQRVQHADQAYTPDFFDRWMEEYASKVEDDQAANAL